MFIAGKVLEEIVYVPYTFVRNDLLDMDRWISSNFLL